MDLSEMKELTRENGARLIARARVHGFRGATQAGAKRFLLYTWLRNMQPVWASAPVAGTYHSPGPWQETREQYRARRRHERMTAKHGRTLERRVPDVLPHTIQTVHTLYVADVAKVVKIAPHSERVTRQYRVQGYGGARTRTERVSAALDLTFAYRAIHLPFVGKAEDGAIILDAAPIEEGYRVRYTRNAAGANVVLDDGYYIGGRLIKSADIVKARKLGLAHALGGAR